MAVSERPGFGSKCNDQQEADIRLTYGDALTADFLGQAVHTTFAPNYYNDTVDLAVAPNKESGGSTIMAFSLSLIAGAYCDDGQNYFNIMQLIESIPWSSGFTGGDQGIDGSIDEISPRARPRRERSRQLVPSESVHVVDIVLVQQQPQHVLVRAHAALGQLKVEIASIEAEAHQLTTVPKNRLVESQQGWRGCAERPEFERAQTEGRQ